MRSRVKLLQTDISGSFLLWVGALHLWLGPFIVDKTFAPLPLHWPIDNWISVTHTRVVLFSALSGNNGAELTINMRSTTTAIVAASPCPYSNMTRLSTAIAELCLRYDNCTVINYKLPDLIFFPLRGCNWAKKCRWMEIMELLSGVMVKWSISFVIHSVIILPLVSIEVKLEDNFS